MTTGDVLTKLLAACGPGSMQDLRDRAILMVAFASGGRGRREVSGLRRQQLTVEEPVAAHDVSPSPLAIRLGRTDRRRRRAAQMLEGRNRAQGGRLGTLLATTTPGRKATVLRLIPCFLG